MYLFLATLAFILGFAVRRGQTCAVLAVREVLERRKLERFWSFIACAAWAAVFAMPIVWLSAPETALAPYITLSWASLLGGFLFGLGAAVNGACAFGTLSRIVSGNSGFLFVLPGLALGAYALQILPFEWLPDKRPNPLNTPNYWAWTAWGAALVLVIWEAAKIKRNWVTSSAFLRRLLWRFWTPGVAMAVVGICGGVMYVFGPDWSYGDAIEQLVATAAIGRPVMLDMALYGLVASSLAGGMTAAVLKREFTPLWPQPSQIAASLSGGALMGMGGAMIPGGNDGIILYAMPAFALYGACAYVTMNLAIALALMTRLRLAGPIGDSN